MFNIHSRSIAFIMAIFCTSPALAQILPKAPDTGTPSGNSTPGTSRPETACPETPKPLTAIVANNGQDFTLSAYPTFWFYVPYRSEQLSRIEFLLLSGNERETIYHAAIQLPNKPGVIKIALPNAPKYMLKQNQTYRWRLNLDCKLDRTIEPDLAIDGWVRRLPMTPQLEAQLKASSALERTYIENQIWYNAIDRAATRYFANTTNTEASQMWSQLLQTLNLPWVHQEPIVD